MTAKRDTIHHVKPFPLRFSVLASELRGRPEKAMARDYYPLMARAIASLEQNTAEARQAVYEHARRVLREQVRDFEPALPASQRMDEMLALEDAIRKVELEAAGGHA